MKYSDYIKLSNFYSVYDLQAESEGYWKSFVANSQFNDLLETAVESFRNENQNRHKSLWILGTYGTGKSHAASVIKHLFCDNYSDVSEFVDQSYKNDNAQLYSQVDDTIQKRKFFPVVLKSVEGVKDITTFSLAIERAVKKALRKANISISTKSGFENYAEHIENNPNINWDTIISNSPHLKDYVNNKKALLKKLNDFDDTIFRCLEEALLKAHIPLINTTSSIEDWLVEVQNELRSKKIADGLLVIWDEFTAIMGLNIPGLLESIQNIAEATMRPENDTYLLLIGHPDSFDNVKPDALRKTDDRFHIIRYKMESISAYHIMAMKLKVENEKPLTKLRTEIFNPCESLITKFADTSNNQSQTLIDINKLFPIHPYTAFLCTYCAQEVGSSSRSVFNFMMDNDDFKNFFEDEAKFEKKELITADFLWDYFYETFRDDIKRYGVVTERFITSKSSLESAGDNYYKVFKSILLLNALNNIAQNENVVPSEENIKNLFLGTPLFGKIDEILNYINTNRIIQRSPMGIYSVQFSALPPQELEKFINEQKLAFNTVAKVLKYGNYGINEITKIFNGLIREKDIVIFSSEAIDPSFKVNRLSNEFKDKRGYALKIAALFAKNDNELVQIKESVLNVSQEELFRNIIFVVFNKAMGDTNYKRFIEYVASMQVSTSHNYSEQAETHKKYALECISDWIKGIRQSPYTLYIRGEELTDSTQNLVKGINSTISFRIFEKGAENLFQLRKAPGTFWEQKHAKSIVETFLQYSTKEEIEPKLMGPYSPARHLFSNDNGENIVDGNLEFIDNVSKNHPLIWVQEKVDEIFDKLRKGQQTFNLGDKLISLTQPPYGLYNNYANMAMLAFAFRKYINELYDANGKPRDAKLLSDDVVEIFKAWVADNSSNKLSVRFGSKEEGILSKKLISCFKLNELPDYNDFSSLTNVRWGIGAYCKKKGYPLWALKYTNNSKNGLVEHINNIIKLCDDTTMNPALINTLLKGTDDYQYELFSLINREDSFLCGFNNYIKQIEAVYVTDSEIEEVVTYLKSNLQGDINLWTEEKVENQVKNWRLNKTRVVPKNDNSETSRNTSSNTANDNNDNYKPPSNRINKTELRNSIKSIPDSSAKEILYKIINDYDDDDILNIIKRYVG